MSLLTSLRRHARRLRHRTATLTLESCPLHTETLKVAAMAPSQVDAALKRGADVIGFTEVHTHLAGVLGRLCAQNGYAFFHGTGDVAVAYKTTLHAKVDNIPVHGVVSSIVRVEFRFAGHLCTVFALHWETAGHTAARAAQTRAIIGAMAQATRGSAIAFYLADSNPHLPLSNPASDPRAALDSAGFPLVYEAPGVGFPAGVGVTTIGYSAADHKVRPAKVAIHEALGSDHQPVTATIDVARVR